MCETCTGYCGKHQGCRGDAVDESCKFVMNPYDEYGVEEALQIVKREDKGEVIIVTVGKESAIATIRSALAMGADRGIFIKTDVQLLDATLTSKAIKRAIEQDGTPDLMEVTVEEGIDELGSLRGVEIRIGQGTCQSVPEPTGLNKHLLDAAHINLPSAPPLRKVHVATRKKLVSERKLN